MKAVIGILVIVVLGVGFLMFTGSDEDATVPEPQDENSEVTSEEEIPSEVEGSGEGNEVVFDLTGKNFAFSVTEMVVKKGDTVTVNFESESGFHDWVVDEFDAATDQVRSGDGVTSVTFVADQTGEFEYYCSVGSHRAQGMVGTLVVEE